MVPNAEAMAWDELCQRMRFFAECLGRGDHSTSVMAAKRLGEAVARLRPLYAARMEDEFVKKKTEESP